MALPDCFINGKAPDATGGANYQYSHPWGGHDISLLFSIAALAMLAT
jgi:hypothetical protein